MNNISLTVPMDKNALTRAAEMLQGLASDLGGQPAKTVESETHAAKPEAATISAPSVGASTTAVDDQHVTEPAEPAATEVFGGRPADAGNAAPKTAEGADAAPIAAASSAESVASVTEAATPTTTTSEAPVQNVTGAAGTGVDLAPATTNPEVSIPWDSRIHAGSKAKLAKKPHGWKMKRGVDKDLVAQVEAELIAAMAASPANPVEPAGNAAPAAVETSATPAAPASPNTAAVAAQPASPAQPAAPAGAITTFPELMAKITASGIDQATVTAAVNKQGLQALPLLAARPDLIPAVAAELFPGG